MVVEQLKLQIKESTATRDLVINVQILRQLKVDPFGEELSLAESISIRGPTFQ